MSKKDYWVRLPVAGIIGVQVEARSEKDAINLALSMDWSVDLESPDHDMEMEELDVYEKTVNGNVNYTPLWAAEAEEL